jgi:hypothetical protein
MEKKYVNREFVAWASHGYDRNAEHPGRVMVLDGPSMRTTHTLVEAGIRPSDVIVVENDTTTFAQHKATVCSDANLEGVSLERGDVFEHLAQTSPPPRIVFLDLMVANVTDAQLKTMTEWERCFPIGTYHAMFVTLSVRGHGRIGKRQSRLIQTLTNAASGFGLHISWGYRRTKHSQPMIVLMFGTDAPSVPLFRPQRIVKRDLTRNDDKTLLVKFWGSTDTFWMSSSDPSLAWLS